MSITKSKKARVKIGLLANYPKDKVLFFFRQGFAYSGRSSLGGIRLPNALSSARLRVVNIPDHFGLGIFKVGGLMRFLATKSGRYLGIARQFAGSSPIAFFPFGLFANVEAVVSACTLYFLSLSYKIRAHETQIAMGMPHAEV